MAESKTNADQYARVPRAACLPVPSAEPYALALETSGRWGSVALGRGSECLEVRRLSAEMRHVTELLPTIDALCRAHALGPGDLGRVYVSGGPGSFTGLRVGITCARLLALGAGSATVRVPTLEVIAQNALHAQDRPDRVVVMLDAKRRRVFAAAFERRGDRFRPVTPAAEVDPRACCAHQPRPCAVMGDGWRGLAQPGRGEMGDGFVVLPEVLNRPRAEIVFRLGARRAAESAFDNPRELIPIYIRRPEAEEVWERKHGGHPS